MKSAFQYLYRFQALQFFDEFYHVEHLQSIDDTVDDLVFLCHRNGGDNVFPHVKKTVNPVL
ncbi:DUF3791 domain-containing protein [Parabacteroides sp.]